jgi:ribosomal protein S18 acetylase RimI-like enzyme
MEIRKAKQSEWRSIKELNQELFDSEFEKYDDTLDWSWPDRNEEYFKKAIKSKDYICLVAVSEGKRIVGYLIGSVDKAKSSRKIKILAELQNMNIAPEFRGKGIGTKLCEKFFEWAKEKKAERIKVVASWKNELGRKFYEKIGFSNFDIVLEKGLS